MSISAFEITPSSSGHFKITGELTRQSISGSQQRKYNKLTENDNQFVDLSGVCKFDSAGLAWLITLFQVAQQKQIKISYSQPPVELVKLARLSRVENLLPIITE